MGMAMAEVQLRNPRGPDLGAVRIEALADTGVPLPDLGRQGRDGALDCAIRV